MMQYNPVYKVDKFPEISRSLTEKEAEIVSKLVVDLDFKNGWIQEFDKSVRCFTPDFEKENPFK